ncbi:sensor histidine kinase [Shewanella sp. KX20019]|uniref:sensor histidine kinase n=1 Tax=Shewanella sp. KX20019 TaxID=2803864 RepID=UPI001925C535|nr:sensor histidine kinase [Shewanella sp. KX20019]QQX78951.1 sensor histidine kinase [Shewanella sp. KX20019]
MKVPSILTNDKLENLYEKRNDKIINLPQQFKILRLGLLPRICQLFITVLKPDSNKKVKFFQFESAKENSVPELLDSPHSLTSLLMSNEVYEKDITSEGEKVAVELKSKINLAIQTRLNESIYRTGQRVQLFAVDHSIKKYAFPNCFYSPESTNSLKQSQFYTNLLDRIIDLSPTKSTVSEEQIDDLGQVIYELIENTEQHGKLEINTGQVNKSVRGLVIDYKLISKEQTSESIGGKDSAITAYLEGIRVDNRTVHLLEISIFDSGEGILKSFSSNSILDISIEDEVEVVEKSFAKGVTSKADSQGYGRGLFNVRSVLDKRKGFISLRTGRVGVYRDFNLQPLIEAEQSPLSLYDETNKLNDNYNELAPVEGLACSILVPLR